MRGRRNRHRRRRSSPAGARQELNVAYFNGCLILAAVIGAFTGSGLVFLLALVALVLGGYVSGDIRPRSKGA